MKSNKTAVLYAVAAAVFYGISSPLSKLLMVRLSPVFVAALLYLGAGVGMLAMGCVRRNSKVPRAEASLTRLELPYVVAMVLLDMAAPVLLMLGIARTNPATIPLLNNFEIVATAVIALVVFKEAVGARMWLAIALITLASIFLSFEGMGQMGLSVGAVFALLACLCWGIENNCTRALSSKDPLQIVAIKGLGSGVGALCIAAATTGLTLDGLYIAMALLLGFVAYGLSIFFYILAQRTLGAARTSAYYALAPFVGVLLSFLFFREALSPFFFLALLLMAAGAYFASVERHRHAHAHEPFQHEHRHSHDDAHHLHAHAESPLGEHSHLHTHIATTHTHAHTPDEHHRHPHN